MPTSGREHGAWPRPCSASAARLVFAEPQTAPSRRTVPLPPVTLAALRAQRATQAGVALKGDSHRLKNRDLGRFAFATTTEWRPYWTDASAWMGFMDVSKDGRSWRIGTTSDLTWLAGQTTHGFSITTAIPPVFNVYATFYPPDGVSIEAHERAVADELTEHTPDQPWWLGYLDTGAHDIVFPLAPKVSLYWDWPYLLVEAGPKQALTWRTGHMRGGSLPDLFFPADHSWLVSALWDDNWTDIGGTAALITVLHHNPLVNAQPRRARRRRPPARTHARLSPGLVSFSYP
jgi:hypothetical protein